MLATRLHLNCESLPSQSLVTSTRAANRRKSYYGASPKAACSTSLLWEEVGSQLTGFYPDDGQHGSYSGPEVLLWFSKTVSGPRDGVLKGTRITCSGSIVAGGLAHCRQADFPRSVSRSTPSWSTSGSHSRSRLGRTLLERRDHTFERDQAVAVPKKISDEVPV